MISPPTHGTKPTIGWFGLDAPLELIEAAGRRAQRIAVLPGRPAPLAAVYGEGGGHPWMRAALSALAEAGPQLERVVLTSTPVLEMWLYNLLLSLQRRGEASAFPVTDLLNISHEDRPSSHRLNIDSLRGLAMRLAATDEAVRGAIAGRNAVRAMLREIDSLRFGAAPHLTGVQARWLMDRADVMSAGAFLAETAPLLAAAKAAKTVPGIAVIYSGPGSADLALYDALEARGLRVVGDDADYGSRAIGPDTDTVSDPIEALARRYRNRSPAPAGWPTLTRVAWLTEMAKARGAKAVLFEMPGFLHPQAWDYPAEIAALAALGVPSIEIPTGDPGQAAEAVLAQLSVQEPGHV